MIKDIREPESWEFNPDRPYVPIFHDGELVGYCQPFYAREIVESLNEQDTLRKALRISCSDLIRKLGGDPSKLDDLVQKYITKAQRPKSGPRAVAAMLIDRQKDLRVSPQEFVKFCDTYKVSSQQLRALAEGKDIERKYIEPLSRILGITPAAVTDVLYGDREK
ncbi:MAG: hypothetical protein SWY16_14060 [Cyanobacteriota bacterium]|nr:hypothetical protein [Cyanobacteriota bacterium]